MAIKGTPAKLLRFLENSMRQDEIAALEQEIAALAAEQSEVQTRIRALHAEEDPAKGVFRSAEIHGAKQERLRLDFEIQFRKNKINRLKFGM